MSQARALIETVSLQHGNNGCFCVGRYKFGKKIVNKKGQLAELVSKGVSFDVVGQRLATKPATLRPSEPLVGVETEFEEIWRCFEDDHVRVIGLYGMGGVGKTTLLTEIHNKLTGSMNSFDYVIWVDVKRNQTHEEVQVSIGKKLGFDEGMLGSKSEHGKYEDMVSLSCCCTKTYNRSDWFIWHGRCRENNPFDRNPQHYVGFLNDHFICLYIKK
ncbi:hypothetical protein Droror1_Dr00021084 [Drosera rotundifolia]